MRISIIDMEKILDRAYISLAISFSIQNFIPLGHFVSNIDVVES